MTPQTSRHRRQPARSRRGISRGKARVGELPQPAPCSDDRPHRHVERATGRCADMHRSALRGHAWMAVRRNPQFHEVVLLLFDSVRVPLLLRGVVSVAHIRAEEIAECYSQAHKARMRAEHALDPQQKRELRLLEVRWLMLAHSYEKTADFFRLAPRSPDRRRFRVIEGGGQKQAS